MFCQIHLTLNDASWTKTRRHGLKRSFWWETKVGRRPRLCREVWGRFWWEEDSAEWTLIRIYLQSFPVLCLCIGEIETASTSSVKPLSPLSLYQYYYDDQQSDDEKDLRASICQNVKNWPKNGGNKVKIWATWLGGGWWAGREPNGLETFLSWHLQHSSSSWPEIAIVYVFVCIVFLCLYSNLYFCVCVCICTCLYFDLFGNFL